MAILNQDSTTPTRGLAPRPPVDRHGIHQMGAFECLVQAGCTSPPDKDGGNLDELWKAITEIVTGRVAI